MNGSLKCYFQVAMNIVPELLSSPIVLLSAETVPMRTKIHITFYSILNYFKWQLTVVIKTYTTIIKVKRYLFEILLFVSL